MWDALGCGLDVESVLVPDLDFQHSHCYHPVPLDFQHSHCCHPVPARSIPHQTLATLLFVPRTYKPPGSLRASQLYLLAAVLSPRLCVQQLLSHHSGCSYQSPAWSGHSSTYTILLRFYESIICMFFLVFIKIYSYCLICLLPTMTKRTNEEFISDWMPQSYSEPHKGLLKSNITALPLFWRLTSGGVPTLKLNTDFSKQHIREHLFITGSLFIGK